jgi:hypothetical protein
MSPVYWKPRYATRRMRERAFARRQAAREAALKRAGGPSFREWLRALIRRRSHGFGRQ